MLLLFIGVLVSSVAVSYSAHWNRQLLNALFAELSVRDKAQAEWGRLLLEQSLAQVLQDGIQFKPSALDGFRKRPLAAAAVVDAQLFKTFPQAGVSNHDFSDRLLRPKTVGRIGPV